MARTIFIFGATSAIAEATARLLAVDRNRFFLVARDAQKLDILAQDLRVRGAERVQTAVCDARNFDRHDALIDEAYRALGGLDLAIIAHGTLPDQERCQASFAVTRRELEVNALGVLSLLTCLANRFEQQRSGMLCAISSVAGDRGRQSNYVYGAAKASVTVFLQGLRNRLYRSGVHVLTVKPGFVDTPLTAGFRKGVLWASRQTVARGLYRAIQKEKSVVYLPGIWWLIMRIIGAIPEGLFKRMRL